MIKSKNILIKPRLSIYKSNLHIYAQVIDDFNHHTIVSCSTLDLEIKKRYIGKKVNNCIIANQIGIKLGILLKHKNIYNIYLEKKYRFTGKVKALVEGIRSQGINI